MWRHARGHPRKVSVAEPAAQAEASRKERSERMSEASYQSADAVKRRLAITQQRPYSVAGMSVMLLLCANAQQPGNEGGRTLNEQ